MGHFSESKHDGGLVEFQCEPSLNTPLYLVDPGPILGRKTLYSIGYARVDGLAVAVHQLGFPKARGEPFGGSVTDKRFPRSVGPHSAGSKTENKQGRVNGTNRWNWSIVPIRMYDSELIQVACETPTASTVYEGFHASAPPQLEPEPAVHPRQWSPVAMGPFVTASKLARFHMLVALFGTERFNI